MTAAVAINLFHLNANKLLDISQNILYTWTVAGDGGIYLKSFFGRAHPISLQPDRIVLFFFACELELIGEGPPFFLGSELPEHVRSSFTALAGANSLPPIFRGRLCEPVAPFLTDRNFINLVRPCRRPRCAA